MKDYFEKGKMDKREYIVGIRFSDREIECLKKEAQKSKRYHFRNGGVNLPDFIRNHVLEQSGIKKESYARDIRNLIYQVRKIGVNVNQVAAKINSGYRGMDAVSTLLENQNRIEQELEILLKKLGEENGNHETDEYKTREAGREQTSL